MTRQKFWINLKVYRGLIVKIKRISIFLMVKNLIGSLIKEVHAKPPQRKKYAYYKFDVYQVDDNWSMDLSNLTDYGQIRR